MKANSRRLTAVVFTDIVGYSAIVHHDEAQGERLLNRQRAVVRRMVARHGGREVDAIGDGFLLEFDSALAAVQAVIAIQQELAAQNSREPPESRVVLRASIHLGDVEHRGRDVYGDGVNTAARLMPHSPEGGLALSAPVLSLVQQRITLPARSIGSPPLKNISTPVEIFIVEAAALLALEAPSSDASPATAGAPWLLRRLLLAVSSALLLALAAVIGWYFIQRAENAAPDKSVAVLPFTNMSEEKGNAYFADGLQDEILTALARIKALKVISRASVERYRGQIHDLPDIAKALGVATVIEGSVQRAGNRVRINVQLIDARNEDHLWAETYDRDVADLFAVQSEVARKVAESLHANLLPADEKTLATAPTRNAPAYNLYLQAGTLVRLAWDTPAGSPSLWQRAIALYEQALGADPDFALAAAALARAHMVMYWDFGDKAASRLAAAKSAADRALALRPDLGEGRYALGLYHYWARYDYAAALEQLELARAALPNSADVVAAMAYIARRQGRWDAALEGLKQATALDPQSSASWLELAWTYELLRRPVEADSAANRMLALSLNLPLSKIWWAEILLRRTGDLAPLRVALEALTPGSQEYRDSAPDFYRLHTYSRDYAAAAQALADYPAVWLPGDGDPLPKALLVAKAYRASGEIAKARQSYAEALRVLEEALKGQPDDAGIYVGLGLTYAGLGRRSEAIAIGQRAVALKPVSKDAVNAPRILAGLAEIYAAVGDHEQALELIRRLLTMPAATDVTPAMLKLDPAWDPMRQNPQFQALLKG